MEQRRLKLLKSLVDVVLFIALFISFLVLYFINETDNYLKGRTEEVTKFNLPVLVVCFEPSYKPSIFGNGSTDFLYRFHKEDFITEKDNLDDILQSASYKLNEDVQIEYAITKGNRTVTYVL